MKTLGFIMILIMCATFVFGKYSYNDKPMSLLVTIPCRILAALTAIYTIHQYFN